MNFKTTLAAALASCLLALSPLCAEPLPTDQPDSPGAVTSGSELAYYVEISISRKLLTLYEKQGAAEKNPIAEYPVGSAVRGLNTYPLGLGRVTGIYFNPWWYPTPYSRQVFRERGIELPAVGPSRAPAELHGAVQDRPVAPDEQGGHLPDTRQQQPEAGRGAGDRGVLRDG